MPFPVPLPPPEQLPHDGFPVPFDSLPPVPLLVFCVLFHPAQKSVRSSASSTCSRKVSLTFPALCTGTSTSTVWLGPTVTKPRSPTAPTSSSGRYRGATERNRVTELVKFASSIRVAVMTA